MKKLNELQSYLTRLRGLMLTLIILCSIGVGNAWGAKHSMTPNQATTGSSSTVYITSLTSFRSESPTGSKIKWQMNQWNPKNLQVKTNQSSAANEFRFYTDSVLPGKITKVVVTFSALTVSSASKLMFKGGTSAQTGTSSGTAGTWNSSTKTLTWTPGSSDNYTYFAFYQNGKAASGTNYLASSDAIVVTYLTKVTLDKNTGSADGVAYFDDNAAGASTATGYTFSAATHASKTCTGYYTAPSDGTKVLNADGSFAATNVSGYITGDKWTYAGGTLKLYAQWESAAPVSPAKTVYLKPNGIWNKDGARFAIYYWKSSDGEDNGWLDMSTYCGPNFTVTIPEGYDKFQFCRMDGAKATNNWDNKWNRTPDLDKPTTNDVYTIEYIDGDAYHNSTGSWGTYTCPDPTTIYLNPNGIWDADGARYAAYYWEGDDSHWVDFEAACGAVTAEIPSGYTNIILCRMNGATATNNWSNCWNQTTDQVTTGHNNYVFTISSINGCTDGKSCGAWTVYSVPTYTISYAKGTVPTGGGSISGSRDDESKTCGTAFTLPSSAVFTTTGYTQDGWATEDGGSKDYNLGGSYTTNAAQAFYPHWNANTYTLTWNLNGGTVTTAGTGAAVDATGSPSSSVAFNSDITAPVVEKDGYDFDGWNTTPATKMPAANTTYTAQWSLKSYTVTWYAGGTSAGNITTAGSPTTNVNHGSKVTTLPTNPDGSGCDKVFVGWTNTTSYTHGTSLLFTDAAGSPTINADASFYAVFATGGTDYELVTSSSTALAAGDEIIFVSSATAGSAYAMGYQNTNNRPQVSVTIASGPKITSPTLATSTSDNTNIYPFILEANDGAFAIKENITGGRYLKADGAGSSGNNYLHSASETTPNTTTEKFTISIASSTSIATITGGNTANNARNVMQYNSGSSIFSCYASASQSSVYIYRKGYSGHTIICSDCGTSVTPTFTAAPTGGTVAVTKGGSEVTSGDAVKTCTSQDLSVTINPASHYTLTGFTATGLSTGTATISPAVNTVVPTTSAQTFTVTVSAGATGTLNLTPTFTEDAHVAINWNVNGVNQSIAATEGLTWVYSGGDLTALPSEPSVPAGCSGTKVFAGWSAKHSDATEEDASYYDDLFTTVGGAPTGISSAKTFYAVFATSSANPLAGEVMWDEPWTGTSDKTTPTSPSSGATVYNSTVLTYAYTNGNTTTQVYADGTMYSGGAAAPELLISKTSPSGVWTVTNIPTGGSAQTELTLSYKTNKTTIAVTSGTSGITIGDATVDGNTYTHTITISHSPSTINNFSLIFTNTGSANARIDDIHLVVPGSGTMTDYVTLCAPSWTITYNKNTEDAVTNLPSPTSVLQSTGSGTLSSTVPERATYTFTGWAETTSGAVAYAAGGSITGVTGDKTLYAVWVKTPVEELTLNYSELNKYVGDPAVTLEVTGVTPAGADATVTWSSNNSTVASVVAATGVVTFGTVGTATITATSTVTGTTTAYCYVTVRNKPTASFTDLIHDGNGTDLSTYHMQNVAGTEIVFPTLDDYATPGDDCDSKHYIFVGWTTSDNNDDPEDHLVASGELEDDQDKVFYAVWADGEEGVSYTQLTTSTFKTSPTKYVIGAIDGDDTFYFNSCAATDANNGNGGCTNAPGTNAPIQFTLSGTADALVATSTEATARYLTPLTAKNFQMSATSKTIQLNDDGTIANPSDESWTLRFNTSEDYLRWYSSATGNAAYFYEVTAGAAVSYRTSCCTNNVLAPTVIATNTAYTVTLTWAAVDGATGYEVSWNGGAFTAATSPVEKTGLTASTDYTYKVRATYDPLVKCGALVASGSVTTDDVYTVTYSGGTGTGSCSPSGSVAPASYEAGATVTLAPTNSFSLTSNTFAAWVVKDADDNDVPVSNNQFTMPAKNVTVTATWTAVEDKYYDRMHDGTDASHGGVADGEGKYYLVRGGCNYDVPALTDDDDGDTDCHTTHYKLLGWIAYSHLKTDGSGEIKPGEESYIFQGGGTKSATGATYYAIWAIMTE